MSLAGRLVIKIGLLTSLLIVCLGLQPLQALAAGSCGNQGSSSSDQIMQGASQAGSDCNGASINHVVPDLVNLLSIVVGIIAIIMIIVGGYKYITSGGDSGNISSAKSTLIYAMVGLLIAALAQFLTHYVIGNVKP